MSQSQSVSQNQANQFIVQNVGIIPTNQRILIDSQENDQNIPQDGNGNESMFSETKRIEIHPKIEVKEELVEKQQQKQSSILDQSSEPNLQKIFNIKRNQNSLHQNKSRQLPKNSTVKVNLELPVEIQKTKTPQRPRSRHLKIQNIEDQDEGEIQDVNLGGLSLKNKLPLQEERNQKNEQDQVANNSTTFIVPMKQNKFSTTIKKGFFAKNQQRQQDQYIHVSSIKKDTSQNSLMSLMTQMSSRNIKTRYKLPSLEQQEKVQIFKPYESPKKSNPIDESKKIIEKLKRNKRFVKSHQITDCKQFAHSKITFEKLFEGFLKRERKCCTNYLYPTYTLQTRQKNKDILKAQKIPFNLGSTYFISSTDDFKQFGDHYLGKVKGNFSGSKWNVYNFDRDLGQDLLIGAIYYTNQWSCKQSFRQIEVYYKNNIFQELQQIEDSQQDLKKLFTLDSNKQKITKIINKKPQWKQNIQCYVLDFEGKSRIGSVKNMILVKEENPQEKVLLIAKRQSNSFLVDIFQPITPLLATAVSLSSFDFKLASQ